jgi:hypothetical protein
MWRTEKAWPTLEPLAKTGPDRGSTSRTILPEALPNSNARRRGFTDSGKNSGCLAKASFGEPRQDCFEDFSMSAINVILGIIVD